MGWVKDPIVLELAESLKRESWMSGIVLVGREDIEVLLITLQALRLMHLQDVEAAGTSAARHRTVGCSAMEMAYY